MPKQLAMLYKFWSDQNMLYRYWYLNRCWLPKLASKSIKSKCWCWHVDYVIWILISYWDILIVDVLNVDSSKYWHIWLTYVLFGILIGVLYQGLLMLFHFPFWQAWGWQLVRPEHQNKFLQSASKNIFNTLKSILYKKNENNLN